MEQSEAQTARPYVGHIWIADDPAIRFSVTAHSLQEARRLVMDKYGEGIISLRNEEDAAKPR